MRESIDIDGDWTDTWGSDHAVTPFAWNANTITVFDNDAMWAVAQNSADDPWSPSLWSKYDWTWDADGELYYCQSTYNAETEELALEADRADAEDLAAGCNGFSWSQMSPAS